jgi:hypothetical protein
MKPKVLALTYPSSAGAEYLKDFESQFQLDVCKAKNREEAIPEIAARVASSGPYEAFMIFSA